jgi:hypothetical protein
VAGELTFGYDDFGGLPYGQAAAVYGTNLAPAVTLSACGDAVSPMLFASNPSTPPWGLFLITDWQSPGVALADAKVQSFELVIQSQDRPDTPIGPVGPLGIRLGTDEAVIQSMFPTEWDSHNGRSTAVIDANGSEVIVSERIVGIADVGGGPMILGILDGVVVTIMWGNPAYVHQQLGMLWCP